MSDLEKVLSEIDIPGLPHNVFFRDVVYDGVRTVCKGKDKKTA